jgi:hypothetical protein
MRPVMADLAQFQQSLWAANVAAGVALGGLLGFRKNYRVYPAFSSYIFLNLIQAALLFIALKRSGFSSDALWRIGWPTQGAVLFVRSLAVAELCRHLLARYKGVWALAWRLLLGCAVLVLVYSLASSKHQWVSALPSVERGLDLAIASVTVGLFVFARYYRIIVDPTIRTMAVGFFLFSSFGVLNDTILERWLYGYVTLWNILGSLAFFAALLLWSWALRLPQTAAAREEALLPDSVYSTISPELNLRLHLLNKQLSQFWKVGAPQP